MSRANEPAYPVPNDANVNDEKGLTIREHVAIEMAKAILTGAVTRGCPSRECLEMEMATKCADALLAELAKPVTP